MDWLNYNHLYYFWTVARAGSIVAASRELLLSQPTLSAQIKKLETALRQPLFNRVGRRLVLSDVGRAVFEYADEMFTLAQQMLDVVKQRPTDRMLRLVVGVSDAVPKLVARSVLAPVMRLAQPIRLVVHEYGLDRLLLDLASYRLDLVLSDSPAGREASVRTYGHLLGESGITFFARRRLAGQLARRFPRSLDGAPMLLPSADTAQRRALNHWFDRHAVRPRIVGEFDDNALLTAFGQDEEAVFPAPSVVEQELLRRNEIRLLGRADGVVERYYAISVERKLKHPAVIAITQTARQELFAPRPRRSSAVRS